MSGYLEVKYPFKSNLGLNPFKSWKRQWCILRPSPTCAGGGSLAVYCSEAGAAAGTVVLPSGCVVRRAKSRSRPYAFAVFSEDEPRKARILLAAPSLNDAQVWMDKIKDLLNGSRLLGTETLLKDSYSVTVITTELSRKCGLTSDSVLTLSSNGLYVSQSQKVGTVLEWKHISDVLLISETADRSRICVVTVDSDFQYGGGELKVWSPQACELSAALKQALRDRCVARASKKLSRSEGDLRANDDSDLGEVRRSSWYSGPSEVSLDDIDLVMSKEAKRIPSGQLSRCAGAGDLAPPPPPLHTPTPFDDSMCDRRSLVSVSSGIYEEIPDLPAPSPSPAPAPSDLYCRMGPPAPLPSQDVVDAPLKQLQCDLQEEPMYESVLECVSAAGRRPPPPLPPRSHYSRAAGSWDCVGVGVGVGVGVEVGVGVGVGVTRHGSLGSLGGVECRTRTLPKPDKSKQTFSVFRKRLKSDSRIASSPKSDPTKEMIKDVETKKKKFEFTPTRDIFKNFRARRKPRRSIGQGDAKSCEYLDNPSHGTHVTHNRGSKSVECLEHDDNFLDDLDLSIEFNDDAVTTLALPQEIVDLILRGREQFKIRLKESPESEYLPMSPIVPPPLDHYTVMSPRNNLA